MGKWPQILWAAAALGLAGGCVERKLTVQSDPPGALVFMNDQEIGRTPFTRSFEWYGQYDVTLKKDGYKTLQTTSWVTAPLYEWPPLDLLSELLPIPLTDHHTLTYKMTLAPPPGLNPAGLMRRAEEMKQENAAGDQPKFPAKPTTQPATTQPAAAKP